MSTRPLSLPSHDAAVLLLRVERFLAPAVQVALLGLLWWVCDQVSRHWMPAVPGAVIGLLLLLLGFFSGGVRVQWVRRGALWLLAEMMLFFVPLVLGAVKYGELLASHPFGLLMVVGLSTALVMVSTAWTVEWLYRAGLARRLRRGTQS
jgi:holin-like protein